MDNWKKNLLAMVKILNLARKISKGLTDFLNEGTRDFSGKMVNVTKMASQEKEAKTSIQG